MSGPCCCCTCVAIRAARCTVQWHAALSAVRPRDVSSPLQLSAHTASAYRSPLATATALLRFTPTLIAHLNAIQAQAIPLPTSH